MAIERINLIQVSNSFRINGVTAEPGAAGLIGVSDVNGVPKGASFTTDYSLSLNGSNQYVNLGTLTNSVLQPTQASMNSTGYTMSFWAYFPSGAPTDYVFNFGRSGTNNYYGLSVNVNNSRYVVFHVFGLNQGFAGAGSNNRNSIRTSATIPNNAWKHIAIVVPAGSMGTTMTRANWKIYINGVSQTIGGQSGNQNTQLTYTGTSTLAAGANASGITNPFNGQLNNVAIWSAALSTNNLVAVYNSGAPIDLSTNAGNYNNSGNLIAWWRFNEGTGTSYTDSSTNSFTGTGVNTPTWSTNVPS